MRDFAVITDSCCSLSENEVRALSLVVLPLSFTLGGKTYRDTPDHADLPPEEFFTRLKAGEDCTTAAVNVEQYLSAMRAELDAGRDVLCVCFSGELSCTYQNACIAADELRGAYPARKLITVDSLCACRGLGMLLWRVLRQQDEEGLSIVETAQRFLRERAHQAHWFFVEDLNHLHRGGRVSKLVAVAGSVLSIRPIMHCDAEGRLTAVGKARGTNGALAELVTKLRTLRSSESPEQTVFLCHANCPDYARKISELLRSEFGITDIRTDYICPVIGAHTGCGTLGLFFEAKER